MCNYLLPRKMTTTTNSYLFSYPDFYSCSDSDSCCDLIATIIGTYHMDLLCVPCIRLRTPTCGCLCFAE